MNRKMRRVIFVIVFTSALELTASCHAAQLDAAADFRARVKPILTQFCYECHADGARKGNLAFDESPTEDALIQNRELWLKVLKNVRSQLMPPLKAPQLSEDTRRVLADWIKRGAFAIDPRNPDPGRVTLRRLNRVEYSNTIRDLMGVEFKADEEFPADDTGYGFDNIGDALNVSPMLLEKYMQAAQTIVTRAVPTVARAISIATLPGAAFRSHDEKPPDKPSKARDKQKDSKALPFTDAAAVACVYQVKDAGTYRIGIDLKISGSFDFDPARCTVSFKVGEKELLKEKYEWQNGKNYHYDLDAKWEPSEQVLSFHLEPMEPSAERIKSAKTYVNMRVVAVQIRGPVEPEKWGRSANFERFFLKDAPSDAAQRRAYAHDVLMRFATRAFRHPADEHVVERLVKIAEAAYMAPDKTFEQGVAQAMIAILASPRFLFRSDETLKSELLKEGAPSQYPLIDEYTLASRLSYFLWSTMPDEELFALADKNQLRANQAEQIKRMVADPRAFALVENFVGQWLQARDIAGISVDANMVLARDAGTDRELTQIFKRFQELRSQREAETRKQIQEGKAISGAVRSPEEEQVRARLKQLRAAPTLDFDAALRAALKRETEMFFEYVMREDRSTIELLDSDYTFLNERLAKHYGIAGVSGEQMRRVTLKPDSPRGGILTQGTVLIVTSNPTRTSPVKRGLFLLDNILGAPTRPAPPEIPALEASEKAFEGKEPSLRELLAVHRDKPLCSSCHNQMDPLGFAFENFNALGMWRERERKIPIDAASTLGTGESFDGVRALKKILVGQHREEFYRCLTEKLMTYALGRGPEYYDVQAVDDIVEKMEQNQGKFSVLLSGIIESAPFQRRRAPFSTH